MPKKIMKKSVYLGVFILFLNFVVSCEKDFTSGETSIINNTKFEAKEVYLDIEMTTSDINSVRADNILLGASGLGEYLLGVYKKGKGNDKKIEASIVAQVEVPSTFQITDKTLRDGQTLSVPHLDEVILKIPLKAINLGKETVKINVSGVEKDTIVPKFKLDSLLGNINANFNIDIYQNDTYLNILDPSDPSKKNSFESTASYQKTGGKLNLTSTLNLENAHKDTLFVYERMLVDGTKYNDTLKVSNGDGITANPFIAIKLDKAKFKTLFFDKFSDNELSSQKEFNNYFRGIIIEASGVDGAMIPLNLAFNSNTIKPSIVLLHTSAILDKDGNIEERVENINEFYIGGGVTGIKNSIYKTTTATNTLVNSNLVQGTSGSLSKIKIVGVKISELTEQNNPFLYSIKNKDANNDGYLDLKELENNNGLLLNDVSLSFYIENSTSVDTTKVPKRLFLYKEGLKNGVNNPSQLRDLMIDGPDVYGGFLELSDNKPNRYRFRLTEYISSLLKGNNTDDAIPDLKLKVYNTTDLPTSITDTIVETYNWNPRSVPVLNQNIINGDKRARIKVLYTIKK